MRYGLMLLLSIFMLSPLTVMAANEVNEGENVRKTCVYKQLDCLERCEYHQEDGNVGPCQANCKKRYPCYIPKNRN